MPHNEIALNRMILIGITVYILLMTVPFVPGAEIGIAMLTAFGAPIAPLVYCATVIALTLAFLIGWLVPQGVIIGALKRLRLHRAANALEMAKDLPREKRLDSLMSGSSPRLIRFGTRYRYLALCIAINTPGNFLIGGGGGIALLAGMSRLYSPALYVLAVMIAVAPVPLFVFPFGM
jgi:hypothetical protein